MTACRLTEVRQDGGLVHILAGKHPLGNYATCGMTSEMCYSCGIKVQNQEMESERGTFAKHIRKAPVMMRELNITQSVIQQKQDQESGPQEEKRKFIIVCGLTGVATHPARL